MLRFWVWAGRIFEVETRYEQVPPCGHALHNVCEMWSSMSGTSLPLWCLGLKDLQVITRDAFTLLLIKAEETELHIPSIMSLCHSRASSVHGKGMTIDLLSFIRAFRVGIRAVF